MAHKLSKRMSSATIKTTFGRLSAGSVETGACGPPDPSGRVLAAVQPMPRTNSTRRSGVPDDRAARQSARRAATGRLTKLPMVSLTE